MRRKVSREQSNYLGFELMESRRLLAADTFSAALDLPTDVEPVPCMVQTAEFPADDVSFAENLEATDLGNEVENENETETGNDAEPASLDPRTFDLSDGMDGYFGAISAEQPSETLQFTANQDGMVDVVVASSFGDAQTVVSISDNEGMLVDSMVDGLDGFNVLTFEVSEGASYSLEISSDSPETEGQFQVTVGFEAFVDQHADETGSESTVLNFEDGQTGLDGRLEQAGDIDTFRFNADESGEVRLTLNETVTDSRVNLGVTISDGDGAAIVNAGTNESLVISFDVEAGNEYYIAISGDAKGTYSFDAQLSGTDIELETPTSESDSGESDPGESDPGESDSGESNETSNDLADEGNDDFDPNTEFVDASDEAGSDPDAEQVNPEESPVLDGTVGTDNVVPEVEVIDCIVDVDPNELPAVDVANEETPADEPDSIQIENPGDTEVEPTDSEIVEVVLDPGSDPTVDNTERISDSGDEGNEPIVDATEEVADELANCEIDFNTGDELEDVDEVFAVLADGDGFELEVGPFEFFSRFPGFRFLRF